MRGQLILLPKASAEILVTAIPFIRAVSRVAIGRALLAPIGSAGESAIIAFGSSRLTASLPHELDRRAVKSLAGMA